MYKAQIDESVNIINHNDITDAMVVFAKPSVTAKLIEEKLVEEKFLAENSVAAKPILESVGLVSCLDDMEIFLIPAYYQTDD